MKHTFETNFKIWDDEAGYFIGVEDDEDGLGLIRIFNGYSDFAREESAGIVVTDEIASMLADALLRKVTSHKQEADRVQRGV